MVCTLGDDPMEPFAAEVEYMVSMQERDERERLRTVDWLWGVRSYEEEAAHHGSGMRCGLGSM